MDVWLIDCFFIIYIVLLYIYIFTYLATLHLLVQAIHEDMQREVLPIESPFGRLAKLKRQCEEQCNTLYLAFSCRRNKHKIIATTNATSDWGENDTQDDHQQVSNDNNVDAQVSDECQNWEGYNQLNQWDEYTQRPTENDNMTEQCYYEQNSVDECGEPNGCDDGQAHWYDYKWESMPDDDMTQQWQNKAHNWEAWNYDESDQYKHGFTQYNDMMQQWSTRSSYDGRQDWNNWNHCYHQADQWHVHDQGTMKHTPEDKRTLLSLPTTGTDEDCDDDWGNWSKDGLKQPSSSSTKKTYDQKTKGTNRKGLSWKR